MIHLPKNRTAVAMGRRLGTSPEALEKMRAHDAEVIWTAQCRVCGAELKGTLAQLKEHTHGETPGTDPEPT